MKALIASATVIISAAFPLAAQSYPYPTVSRQGAAAYCMSEGARLSFYTNGQGFSCENTYGSWPVRAKQAIDAGFR